MAYPASSALSDLHRETEGIKYDDDWADFIDQYNPGLDLAESQRVLAWQNQELNQTFQTLPSQLNYQPPPQGLASTEAGASHSVRKRGGRNPPRNPGKTQVNNEKKKEIDRRYREKCKESKMYMEQQLDQLGQENTNLHNENKNLVMEKESINKNLQSAETETKELKSEIRKLTTNMNNQQVFVDSILKKLDDVSNHENQELEIKKLQNEIMVLRQMNWEDWPANKSRLQRDIVNLEHENNVLKVQVDALCEKIHNDLNAKACKTAAAVTDLWAGSSTTYEGLD